MPSQPENQMIHVCFLIRSLDIGGAETQLSVLARGLNPDRFRVTVLCYYGGGALEAALSQAGIEVINLAKKGRWDIVGFFVRLVFQLRAVRPDILHCFLGPSNVLGMMAGSIVSIGKIVWSIRASAVDMTYYDPSWKLLFGIERYLSRFAHVIIANSHAGKAHHVAQGFPGDKILVVSNGIDTAKYQHNPAAGRKFREGCGFDGEVALIGLVTRIDPMKDHSTFLRAAALISAERDDVQFICVGTGAPNYIADMKSLSNSLELQDRVHWLGECNNMVEVLSAIGIATSSSAFGEGFSNALGEAMSCGLPCVATDIGDSSLILGDLGKIVPPRDPAALAAGWREILALDPATEDSLRNKCRERIVGNFSVPAMVKATEQIYGKILQAN